MKNYGAETRVREVPGRLQLQAGARLTRVGRIVELESTAQEKRWGQHRAKDATRKSQDFDLP